MIGGSSTCRGWEFFSLPRRPDRLWGPPSLPLGNRSSFLEGKAAARDADNSPISSAEVK